MSLFSKKQKHVKFVPKEDFLDGSDRFLKGKVYKAPINKVRYFERNGWLEGSIAAPPDIVNLNVESSNHGTKDTLNG